MLPDICKGSQNNDGVIEFKKRDYMLPDICKGSQNNDGVTEFKKRDYMLPDICKGSKKLIGGSATVDHKAAKKRHKSTKRT